MSTHAALGIEMEDGSIMGCYVHYDGATMAERIENFLQSHTTTDLAVLIARAQSTGGMRSFHTPTAEHNSWRTADTAFLDDNEPYVITSQNWSEDHMCTYAWYLVNYQDSTFTVKNKY